MPSRIASVNSFGFGGSNGHAVIQDAASFLGRSRLPHKESFATSWDSFLAEEKTPTKPQVLIFSANDEQSLKANVKLMRKHLIDPRVNLDLSDIAYTLSERRSRLFNRGFLVTRSAVVDEHAVVYGKKGSTPPRIGFVFTGQGAQWPQMGKSLLDMFPAARCLIERLDVALQTLHEPPLWSLLNELTEVRTSEHLRDPTFSQPLTTALQLALIQVFEDWGIVPESVVGHSSGEIAAACAAGYLTQEEAIKVAYYRGGTLPGQPEEALGMLAIGLGASKAQEYIGDFTDVQIACYNSPSSVTASGKKSELEVVQSRLQADGHFARLLHVDRAYHSRYMSEAGEYYEGILNSLHFCQKRLSSTTMFSSVNGHRLEEDINAAYWKRNMTMPVSFDQACHEMLSGQEKIDIVIEIGPAGGLAGPVSQIIKDIAGCITRYFAATKRDTESAAMQMFDIAGQIFIAGGPVNFPMVNDYGPGESSPAVITDLPNYAWNHANKYWYESDASKDWRFRPFIRHDLLGSKILGTPWYAPTFKNNLRIKDVPWLRDHKMGSDIIFPASGYLAMAMEALFQCGTMTSSVKGVTTVNQLRYRFRNVRFDKAMVLEEEEETKVFLTLSPRPGANDSRFDFVVSTLADGTKKEHCTGLIRLEEDILTWKIAASSQDLVPLRYAAKGSLWYAAQRRIGFEFGPSFQKVLSMEQTMGQRRGRVHVSLAAPPSKWSPQTLYPMHPATIDGCFQSASAVGWAGGPTSINVVLLPAWVDDLVINPVERMPDLAISVANAKYIGRGRLDEAKSYSASCSVYDPQSGALILQLTGLHSHRLDTEGPGIAKHTYCRSVWKPDISLLSQESFMDLRTGGSWSSVHEVIDMAAHKKPMLKVLEINLSASDSSSLWFNEESKPSRTTCGSYTLACSDAVAVLAAQDRYQSERSTSFRLIDIENLQLADLGDKMDLVIIKVPKLSHDFWYNIARNIRNLLLDGGQALFLQREKEDTNSELQNDENSDCDRAISLTLLASKFEESRTFSSIGIVGESEKGILARAVDKAPKSLNVPKSVAVVHLTDESNLPISVTAKLEAEGWHMNTYTVPLPNVLSEKIVLIIDEAFSPVLSCITEAQWRAMKKILGFCCKVLWVTTGSQFNPSLPDHSLVHGLFRTIRSEDPSLHLITLDIDSIESKKSLMAINNTLETLLHAMPKSQQESEFVERDGVVYVNRVVPDLAVNQIKDNELIGAKPVLSSLHELAPVARLRAERLGTLDALVYSQITEGEIPVEQGTIEVEIHAAGLNFKDIAVVMGLVPENEHLLGCEGAGVVRRVADGVTNFKVGDRVVVFRPGTFGNRIQIAAERAHRIPDTMSFEDAATIPAVYLTSMYSLFDMADLKKGQTVLIHSAAGGIGISCIQLAQIVGAEIYVTVGSDEKKQFLSGTFGIPPERIFSSRTKEFASQILKVTNGRGIDVIINSLTGQLLDETWRICADGGVMIELGKKDILDRNSLSMEPFDRNCSFRAVDSSHKQITDTMVHRLCKRIFKLLEHGFISPIHPIKTFGFDEIPAALAYMRSGRHIGKIVITNGDDKSVQVSVRPAPRILKLSGDVSYLIVGGLKGLCGSLAVHLAKHGAKHIISMSRGGISDERSQGIVMNCNALGCQVSEAKGDVSKLEDVQLAFDQAVVPIGGVIQGAMVLRDKPFESMTVEDYHTTISSKVQGTWNLHNVSLKQEMKLDFFTMLSSISGVVGQKGQANYAAANVFLDTFANYRQSLGLPANSIDLGVIEDVGYVAEKGGMNQYFDKGKLTGIDESVLHKILSYSIFQQISPANTDTSTQLITGIAVPQADDSVLIRDARFAGLFVSGDSKDGSREGGGKDGSKDLQAFFLLLRSGAQHSTVLEFAVNILQTQFMKTLRLEVPMEPAKSLVAYGLDSLSAVEIRNWIRAELRAEVSLLDITNASSLYALCEKIIVKIGAFVAG